MTKRIFPTSVRNILSVRRLSFVALKIVAPPASITNRLLFARLSPEYGRRISGRTLSHYLKTTLTDFQWISGSGGKVEYVRTAGGSVRIFVDTLWREPDAGSAPITSAHSDR